MTDTHLFPSEEMSRNATRVWDLAKSIKIAMVSFSDQTAAVENVATTTRPLRGRFQDNSNMIRFILPRSSLFADLKNSQPVLVTFSNGSSGDHIAFQGTLSACDDRSLLKALWDSHADIHFPQGPEDPSAALVQFEPHAANFWTGGQDFVSFAVHYITAKLTGEPQAVGKKGMVLPLASAER